MQEQYPIHVACYIKKCWSTSSKAQFVVRGSPLQGLNISGMLLQLLSVTVSGKQNFNFRVLDKTGGNVQLALRNDPHVIVACCVLHNIAMRAGLGLPVDEDLNATGLVAQPLQYVMAAADVLMGADPKPQDGPDGQAARRAIIQHRFM